MILTVLNPIVIEFKYFSAELDVRYWEDANVNGIEDTEGDLIPLRDGDIWRILIDVDTGVILDWPKGIVASTYYKVCDAGSYKLLDVHLNTVYEFDEGSYVPKCLSPDKHGYGDYVILEIDENGRIEGWNYGIRETINDLMEWS